MAMRMTGMMSGMDTESIIQELVAARRKKVDVKKKEQTRINWKQEIWKELNTKLKRLQSKYIANMRFTDAYSKKTTKVSNSNAVSIITGENAMNGVQTLEIGQLAKSAYLTGGKVDGVGGKEVTALSTMSDIGFSGNGVFTVKNGDASVDIKVDGSTTISDVLNQIKSVGLNANFDAKQQRFYITAAESGEAGDFSFTASNTDGQNAMKLLGLQMKLVTEDEAKAGVKGDLASWKEYDKYKQYYVAGDKIQTLAKMQTMIDADVASRVDSYLSQYKDLTTALANTKAGVKDFDTKYNNGSFLGSYATYEEALEAYNNELKTAQTTLDGLKEGDAGYEDALKNVNAANEKITDLNAMQSYKSYYDQRTDVESYINVTDDNDGNITGASATTKLTGEVEDRYYQKAEHSARVIAGIGAYNSSSVGNKVSGQDAEITLNGATYTNKDNTFEINGLTITALDVTKAGEEITVTTQQDTDGIYDMVKNFLKEYNEIVNEMDKLYNAASSKGYEPLTDEEKESMSEKEVEKWETKIKDSILRRDDNLSSVNSALQSIMASGFNVNGKTMYLYDFGIETLGYFEAPDNEKHAYHIAGDSDDEYTMNSADKLKSMISNDPDTVISFFSQLSRGLYDKMSDMSKSVEGYRSFGNFYDDKKMKSDYDSYTSKIKEMETKLNEYEDKWYKKFSKMETALARMQSNMSAVTGLLGG